MKARLGCILLVLIVFSSSVSARDNWINIQSKNFTCIGNASEGDMKKIVSRLEEFREVLSLMFTRTKIQSSVPTTVVVFKDDDSFKPFKPRYKGKTENDVRGYFVNRPDGNYIVLSLDKTALSPYEVIFHEYEHFVLHNNMKRAPLWLNEGLAEYYSTFTSDDQQKVTMGAPIGRHIMLLRERPLMPLKTLLTINHKSPEYHEGSKVGVFYAESWALVHYLMNGNELKRRPQLVKFLSQLSSDIPLEESFKQSFGTDYAGMEEELRNYVSKFLFPTMVSKFTEKFQVAGGFQVGPMPEAAVQQQLGELLLSNGRLEEAEARLHKALSLDPANTPSRVSLALLRARQRRSEEAISLLREAVKADARNYLAHYYLGIFLAEAGKNDEAIQSLKQSIACKPDHTQAFSRLGYIYDQLGREDDAMQAFRDGLSADLSDSGFYRSLAYLYWRRADGMMTASDALTFLRNEGWQDDSSAYMALAAYFGNRLSKREDQAGRVLNLALSKLDSSSWPYPVFRYLKSDLGDDALMALATDKDKQTEAHAYVGLKLALEGKKDEAVRHLEWVKENGNRDFVEYPLSLAELGRLGNAQAVGIQ
jgi:tetratricopeptide (TPR) repeat protein